MWMGIGGGADIDDPKTVFHQHDCVGHHSGPGERKSALARHLLSVLSPGQNMAGPNGPYIEFEHDLGFWVS